MSPLIEQVLNWGRSQKLATGQSVTDRTGLFQAEALRRELRQAYLKRRETGAKICGDFRRGYELMLGQERVGVSGPGQFRVYYRCQGQPVEVAILFDGVAPTTEVWADNYGLMPAF